MTNQFDLLFLFLFFIFSVWTIISSLCCFLIPISTYNLPFFSLLLSTSSMLRIIVLQALGVGNADSHDGWSGEKKYIHIGPILLVQRDVLTQSNIPILIPIFLSCLKCHPPHHLMILRSNPTRDLLMMMLLSLKPRFVL